MALPSTIFALSSGAGRAGVAIVRISGPDAGAVLRRLAGELPTPRRAVLRTLRDPADDAPLDQALVLWFPAPHSFTGEPCAELHLHGGVAVVAGVLDALGNLPGCALAEPGAFTRRAFENGKLDLTEVEGLSDLIDAQTHRQRLQALGQLGGRLTGVVEGWRQRLIQALGLTEAAIDFSDEGDVSQRALADATSLVAELLRDVKAALADGRRGEILRDGFRVAIIGAPNVGKSSLINALSRRDVAIVSDEPGTTRDVVEVSLDLAGIPVLFADTAGLRETAGKVELEGIRRSIGRARDADLILWLRAFDDGIDVFPAVLGLERSDHRVLAVCNKIDLNHPTASFVSSSCIGISTLTGAGIADLISAITERAVSAVRSIEPALVTRERQRRLLEDIGASLEDFLSGSAELSELRAEDLRRAAAALGRITGRVDPEEVLGEIFGRFCIGK